MNVIDYSQYHPEWLVRLAEFLGFDTASLITYWGLAFIGGISCFICFIFAVCFIVDILVLRKSVLSALGIQK